MVTATIGAQRGPERRVKYIGPPSFSPLKLVHYLHSLGEYFDLLLTLSLHRVKVRYKQSALGLAWALVQPLALMAIYTVIFSVVTRMPSEGVPYSLFVYSALLPWTFFSGALTTSSGGLVSHTHLITKVYFPREILPLTYVIAALFDLLVAGIVMAGMMIFYRVPLTIQTLWVLPILAILVSFATALSLFLSALQVKFRDIGLAMPLAMQLWMFATPVVYPLSAVPARFRGWYVLNPMVGVVENFRKAVLQAQPPDRASLETAALVSALVLPLSYLYFKQQEATMADII